MVGIGSLTEDLEPVVIHKKTPNAATKKDEKVVNAARRAGAEIESARMDKKLTQAQLAQLINEKPQIMRDQLITRSENVSKEIRKILTDRATNFNIDDVSITSLTFGKVFTAAIEVKKVDVQDVERAKFIVKRTRKVLLSEHRANPRVAYSKTMKDLMVYFRRSEAPFNDPNGQQVEDNTRNDIL
ncbi:prohibitin-1-like [Hibiscus syriacus]|uniref:prohibitin-1-like n=1 Tax=Hibiscus syriacus TaxID=106335 RepID=UPI0019239283|nr:prohibitin-1-like [Hibiscus syriacus]